MFTKYIFFIVTSCSVWELNAINVQFFWKKILLFIRFPFDNGRKFTLRIITTADCYRVYVNNDDFIHYNHRIPPNEVYYLVLGGGAEYYEAHVQNNFVSTIN